MPYSELIADYLSGPNQLRQAVAGMTEEQLDAQPISGLWSTRQVVCHIADFEPVYADRMKRVIAEAEPTFFGGDPDTFAAKLAYEKRDVEVELRLIEVVRLQMARILETLDVSDFDRVGIHAEDGPLDLKTLLTRITNHLPHHVRFITQKRDAILNR